MRRLLILFSVAGLLGGVAPSAQAQYMYLDTNGDGAHSAADVLQANGSPTTVDIWIRTNANRDGAAAFCNQDFSLPLTINSYVVNLEAVNGTVSYVNFINRQPAWSVNFGQINSDGVHYKNGYGGPNPSPPGTYHLATLTVLGLSGAPDIRIVDRIPGSLDFTSFGSACFGNDFDNTYKLAGPSGGSDWFDADGTGGTDVTNIAPVLAPIGNKTGSPNVPVTFTASATDPDVPPQSLTYSLGLYSPQGATIHPSTGAFSWTPLGEGTYPVTISVTDNGTPALSDFEGILIQVSQPTQAPTLSPIGNKTIDELNLLTFTVTATDPPGGGLTYTLGPGAPEGASIRPGSGLFEWYVAEQQAPGLYPITVRVTSNGNGLSDSETFLVNAIEVNVPPHFTGGTQDITVQEGETATQQLTAFDADVPAPTLFFTKTSGPSFALVSAAGLITVSPGFLDSGSYVLGVRVSDGTLLANDALDITVLGASLVADAGGPYQGVVGVPVPLDGTGSSDPDGTPLTYRWNFGDGVEGSGPTPAHTYQAAAEYDVTLTVTADGETASDATTATILPDLDMVVFTTGGNKTIRLNSGKSEACVQMEPVGGAFDILDVDPNSVRMTYGGSSIPAITGKSSVGTDKNQNGVDEMTACFSKDDLRTLFAGLPGGEQSVSVVIEATHSSGAPIQGAVTLRVKSGGGQVLAIAPNPLNPSATATFSTSRAGFVRVTLYDLQGRLVRTIMDVASAPAGYHDVSIDGQDANGGRLASGVYYLRLHTTDGTMSRAITILK